MIILTVRHRVKDYKTWKREFDKLPPGKGGAVFHRVSRTIEDANDVLVLAGFKTLSEAQTFVKNPDLKAAMATAGVEGAPRFEMYEQLEAVGA